MYSSILECTLSLAQKQRVVEFGDRSRTDRSVDPSGGSGNDSENQGFVGGKGGKNRTRNSEDFSDEETVFCKLRHTNVHDEPVACRPSTKIIQE